VAVGARTALGLTAESSAAAARAGISRIASHPFMLDASGEQLRCARDTLVEGLGADRLIALATHALREVIEKVLGDRAADLPVLLALPETRPGFSPADAQRVVTALQKLPGPVRVTVEAFGDGHAGALHALEVAMERIARGRLELCVVGGVDSYLDVDTIDWLDADKRLIREGVRSGFYPGEGAGMVALAAEGLRASLRLPSLASLRGCATARERRSIDSPEGLLGEGLAEALHGATAELSREPVDEVFCDINGERHRTDDWGLALLRSQGIFREVGRYFSATDGWGDVGAASGALGCVLAVQAWRRRYATGALALVCGSSDGGLRGAAVLEQGRG
jgi:3-oxoacyl-[acyl-carrier-protein] synthase-1